MKKFIGLQLLLFLITGVISKIDAQVTLNDNLAGAELIAPLTIRNSAPLHFGVIAIPSSGGSVSMNTLGARTPTGAGITVVSSGKQATAAVFEITGTPGDSFYFNIQETITVTQKSGGSATMTISNLVTKVDNGQESPYDMKADNKLNAVDGKTQVLVGGTLNIGNSQPLGEYTGNYWVTVDYL